LLISGACCGLSTQDASPSRGELSLRIAYVTTYDANDVRNWSGSGYFIARTLESSGASVEFCGPLRVKRSLLAKGRQMLCERVRGKIHGRGREPWQLRNYARQVKLRLRDAQPDVVFSPGTIAISLVECRQPIVFWTDALFESLVDFYPQYTGLCPHTLRDAHAMEKAALDRCALAIFSSTWAARSAIETYGAHPGKVRVVPFGANLANPPSQREALEAIRLRPTDQCNLLFIGMEWARKGADLALATAERLHRWGLRIEMTMIGVRPPLSSGLPSWVRALGYLDKRTEEDRGVLHRELSRSHFLVLPSRAECCAVVLAEANAFGVPCITTKVGGIPTVVRSGVNGEVFPVESFIDEAAAAIQSLLADQGRYRELAESARHEYDARLNWEVAGREVTSLLGGLRGSTQ